jgi:hypothetical protein
VTPLIVHCLFIGVTAATEEQVTCRCVAGGAPSTRRRSASAPATAAGGHRSAVGRGHASPWNDFDSRRRRGGGEDESPAVFEKKGHQYNHQLGAATCLSSSGLRHISTRIVRCMPPPSDSECMWASSEGVHDSLREEWEIRFSAHGSLETGFTREVTLYSHTRSLARLASDVNEQAVNNQ